MIEREFVRAVRGVIHTREYQSMKRIRHHVRGNAFEHSVRVAYLCYKHHKRFGMKTNLDELIRGALLHDYYLYDRTEKKDRRLHWLRHPHRALQNAERHYPSLTDRERDAIRRHMFPLTLIPPRTAAGWLVCFYDKVAAIGDRFEKRTYKKERRKHAK